jgi:putative transcriptional regulator
MTKANPTEARMLREAHEQARALFRVGAIDSITMREFDALCLKPVRPYGPAKIRRLRAASGTSQAVFAAMLNVKKATVAAWEQGTKTPSGPALKLLQLVERKGLDALV